MNDFWSGLWAIFMNNGMHAVILMISVVMTSGILQYISWRAERDQRIEMMATLTPQQYRDYLRWKALLEETRRKK